MEFLRNSRISRKNSLIGVNLKKEVKKENNILVAFDFDETTQQYILKESKKGLSIKTDKGSNAFQFSKLLNIAKCNIEGVQTRSKIYQQSKFSKKKLLKAIIIFKNKYDKNYILNYYKDNTDKEYKEKNEYTCSSANCLKCKKKRHKQYLNSRIFKNYDYKHMYFITISTDIEYLDQDFNEKTKETRSTIRNIFSYLQNPYLSSLEIGDSGNKLHFHLIVWTNLSMIEISNFIKVASGLYCNVANKEITNYKDVLLYINKLIGYSSKFTKDKDQIATENFIKVNKTIFNIFTTKYLATDFKLNYKAKNILDAVNFFETFQKIESQKNLKNTNNNNKTYILYYYLSKFKNRLKEDIVLIANIKNIDPEKFIFLDDKGFYNINGKQDYLLDAFANNDIKYKIDIINSLLEFYISLAIDKIKKEFIPLQNWIIDNTQKTEKGSFKLFSNFFFTSATKKRISSNLSILKSENIRTLDNTQRQLEFSSIQFNISKKDIKHKKELYYNIEINNSLNLKLKKYRIDQIITDLIIKNNVFKKNKYHNKFLIDQNEYKIYYENDYKKFALDQFDNKIKNPNYRKFKLDKELNKILNKTFLDMELLIYKHISKYAARKTKRYNNIETTKEKIKTLVKTYKEI